jgi:hypothetical protein
VAALIIATVITPKNKPTNFRMSEEQVREPAAAAKGVDVNKMSTGARN